MFVPKDFQMQHITAFSKAPEDHMDDRQGNACHQHHEDCHNRLLPPLQHRIDPIIPIIICTSGSPIDDVKCQVNEGNWKTSPELPKVPWPVGNTLIHQCKNTLQYYFSYLNLLDFKSKVNKEKPVVHG